MGGEADLSPPILELIYFPLFQSWFYSPLRFQISSAWSKLQVTKRAVREQEYSWAPPSCAGPCPLGVVHIQGTSGSVSHRVGGRFSPHPAQSLIYSLFHKFRISLYPHSRREQKEFSPGTISEYLYHILLFCQIIIFFPVSHFIGLKLKLFRAFPLSLLLSKYILGLLEGLRKHTDIPLWGKWGNTAQPPASLSPHSHTHFDFVIIVWSLWGNRMKMGNRQKINMLQTQGFF